jgi:hypothetical protein
MSRRRTLAIGLRLLASIAGWRDIKLGSLKESHFTNRQAAQFKNKNQAESYNMPI